jgi:hypothetical protein
MRKLMFAAAAAAIAIPGAALADHQRPTGSGPGGVVNTQNPDGFRNRGQCESALARETNRQRQNPEERTATREGESTSEFQRNMRERFECDQDETTGAWYVVLSH